MDTTTDRGRWRSLAARALSRTSGSGVDPADVERLLTTTTYDGVEIRPLYTEEDGGHPFPRSEAREAGGWRIRQHHRIADPGEARRDLDAGVTSLWVAGGAGLPGVLAEIDPAVHTIVLDAGDDLAAAAETLLRYAADRPGPLEGGLGADPITRRVPGDDATALAVRCARSFPGLRAFTVDATVHHDAGGSDAEELGCGLAVAVEYLRRMTGAGLTVGEAFQQIEHRYAATADQFATIAKLRAARRLWARVAEVFGAGPVVQVQHAVTSGAMMTVRDPWNNMLRATLACFGAGVGGADAVTVRPYDDVLESPGELGRRVARNTGAILLDESRLGAVPDPAGGSWFVESLTDGLAGAAWDWFTEIEHAGGAAAALESGLVEKRLAETRDRRRDDIASGRTTIVGVTAFPDPDETPHRPAGPDGAPSRHRYAEDFE